VVNGVYSALDIYNFHVISIERKGRTKKSSALFLSKSMFKNFLETFFTNFSKKVLDMEEEHVYNVPVATKQGERNKDKRETELSVRISKRKSRTAKKSSKKFQKVLDKVSEL
jgi:hypothetical protein